MAKSLISQMIIFTLSMIITSSKSKLTKPNIIFMLMDDIGWNDVSFNLGQFPTPNIDSLKYNGISLNRHYIHLMCSPSRSQIITGRYAMYQGFGKMLPWDYTEIGGLPQGQATIADWLKWGGYNTYAIGKWHMGYSSDILLPLERGFNHFFGFYQGAIHYDNLKYIDIKYGDSNHFDFWNDGEEEKELAENIAKRHESINSGLSSYQGQSIFDDNTMYLYREKILDYIENEKNSENNDPFYMYLALQTIHGPLNEVPSKVDDCLSILPSDATTRRHKYCQNMLLTDDVIGDVINKLKEEDDEGNNLWDNTLIVFTSDNGGDVSNKGCNYPLRGTKGTLFDGNLKTIALISGGIIPEQQYDTSRDVLFSSLDWTPTLLKFANLLPKIERKDYSWDGINQYDVIMNDISDDDEDNDDRIRDHIVMNIGLKNLESASIVFKYNNILYKYISKDDKIDRWAYIRDDGWCIPDENGNFGLILDDVDNTYSLSHAIDNKFLFDLTNDIAEKTNLLLLDRNEEIVNYAKSILHEYTDHYLYSEPLTFLWNRLPAGDPTILGDGSFVKPFLNEQDYTWHIRKGFHTIDEQTADKAEELGVDIDDINRYSKALQGTYFNKWQPPNYNDDTQQDDDEEEQIGSVIINMPIDQFIMLITSILFILFCGYRYYFYSKRNNNTKYITSVNNEYTALISNSV